MAANKSKEAQRIATAYQKKHLARLAVYQRQIESLIDTYTKELATLGGRAVGGADLGAEPFAFSRYPATTKKLNTLLAAYKKKLLAAVVNGVTSEWELAQRKNDVLADLLFGNRRNLTDDERKRYYKNTDDALAAFRSRVTAGLNLSDRVWRHTEQYKAEIELGLDCGIRDGVSAARMATELKQYLQYPDKLFRRVRNQHGQLVLSRAARAFHPSAGVYRSSYKNALRLARTETNMAYRASDHERVQHLDFVLGINIQLSNNHTCNGKPLYDICDELAGRYPKEFKFVGWHPQCRCFVTTILMDDDEIDARRAARRAGKPLPESKNKVKDVPEKFKAYVAARKDKLASAPNPPYWYRDNPQYVGGGSGSAVQPVPAHKTALEIAEERHLARTPETVADIRQRWRDSRIKGDLDGILPFSDDYPVSGTVAEKQAWVRKATRVLFAGSCQVENLVRLFASNDEAELDGKYRNYLTVISEYLQQIGEIRADMTYRDVPDDVFLEYRDRLQQIQDLRSGRYKPRGSRITWERRCLDGYTNISNLFKAGADFSKVSAKMPVELLDDGIWFAGKGSVHNKAFFNLKQRLYVPVIIADDTKGFFAPAEALVHIGRKDERYSSPRWRESLIYHEFGHAYAEANSLDAGKDAQTIVDDFAKLLKRKCPDLEARANGLSWKGYLIGKLSHDGRVCQMSQYSSPMRKLADILCLQYGTADDPMGLLSMISSLSDVMGAATMGATQPFGGHSTEYWRYPYTPSAETIAHISETYFQGNAYIEQTCPELYRAFMEYAAKYFK